MLMQTVRRNRILAMLPAGEAESLAAIMGHGEVRSGTILQEAGEPVERVYFPQSGVVSLQVMTQNGNSIETGVVGNDGAVGPSRGFGKRPSFTRAVVHVGGYFPFIPGDALAQALEKNASLRDVLLGYGDFLTMQAQQLAACNACHGTEARFARWLLQRSDQLESENIPATQDFIAQIFGVRRTTITVVAHEMQTAGVIRYRRGAVQIADRGRLERLACECYGTIRNAAQALSRPLA